jgi:hypothetical protein
VKYSGMISDSRLIARLATAAALAGRRNWAMSIRFLAKVFEAEVKLDPRTRRHASSSRTRQMTAAP